MAKRQRLTERPAQRQEVRPERQRRKATPLGTAEAVAARAQARNGNGAVRIRALGGPADRIVVRTSDRIREQLHDKLLPAEVQSILRLALTGSLIYQQRLFERMCDTWPRLQKDINELASAVVKVPWNVEAAKDKDQEEATPEALDKADLIERAIVGFHPDIKRQQRDFGGLIRDIVFSIFLGHNVDEIYWEQRGPETMPFAAKMLPARYYGYPILTAEEDRLMLNRMGSLANTMGDLEEFPPYQFVIGINQRHTAHPTVAAMFRCLAGWWLASVYGLEWFMSFAELFGVPYRIGKYQAGSIDAKNALLEFMRDLGSGGWGVFPDNVSVEIVDTSKGSGEIPQKILQEMADRVVDILILGQTLTTDVASGGSGNRALGQVHQDIRDEVLQNAVEYVGSILNTQFVPALIELNYGNTLEMPQFSGSVDQPQDEKALAERDAILFGRGPGQLGIPIGMPYLRNHNKLPAPADGEELYVPPEPQGGAGGPGAGQLAAGLLMAAAAGHGAPARPNLETLVDSVMENLSGVSAEWLKPVKPIFRDLVHMARDGTVTDQDFIRTLTEASRRMPDLFHQLDTEALEQELHKVLSTGLINGVTDRHIEEGPKA